MIIIIIIALYLTTFFYSGKSLSLLYHYTFTYTSVHIHLYNHLCSVVGEICALKPQYTLSGTFQFTLKYYIYLFIFLKG